MSCLGLVKIFTHKYQSKFFKMQSTKNNVPILWLETDRLCIFVSLPSPFFFSGREIIPDLQLSYNLSYSISLRSSGYRVMVIPCNRFVFTQKFNGRVGESKARRQMRYFMAASDSTMSDRHIILSSPLFHHPSVSHCRWSRGTDVKMI